MTRPARQVDRVPMPARIARLPRNKVGYPVPWFVADVPDSEPDFRIADAGKQRLAIWDRLCWVCGGRLGAHMAFVIGPMCAVNRISAEPPSHRDCAIYSARVCPFLSNPAMRRREGGKPDDTIPAAGESLDRNPGVTLVWVTRKYQPFRPPIGHEGLLFSMGDPTETTWWTRGRPATRAEVTDAMNEGLPALAEACQLDADPADSLRHLTRAVQRAIPLIPSGAGGVPLVVATTTADTP